MRRRFPWLVFALALAGCDRARPYREIFEKQREALRKTTDVLKSITDAATMEKAREELLDLQEEFQTYTAKARSLPRPDNDVLLRLEESRGQMEKAVNDLQREVIRIKELPRGKDFLQEFRNFSGGQS